MNEGNSFLIKKDYFLVSFIGASFALFSVPIIRNINVPFFELTFSTVLFLILFFVVLANAAIWIAGFIGRKIPVVFQFAKFAAVGAFNTFLDWGILNILIALTGIAGGAGYALFKGLSFAAATGASYFWNKYWTFEKKEESDTKEVGSFIGVSMIGVVVNITLASLVVYLVEPSETLTAERIANIGAASATIVSLIWNFTGYKFLVFKK